MPFNYYNRLSGRAKRTYRKSDAISSIQLNAPERLQPRVDRLAEALREGKRAQVQTAAQALSNELTRQLGIRAAEIKVLSRRPLERDGSELHGRCSWETDDGPPLIEIWMRTHHKLKVVAFKTFLRTLIHELCHHFDYELHGLDDTFHTKGFFKRESSLVRQLIPAADSKPARKSDRKADPRSDLAADPVPDPVTDPTPDPLPGSGADPQPDPKTDPGTALLPDLQTNPSPDPPSDPRGQLRLPW